MLATMFEALILAGIISKPIEPPKTIIDLKPKIVKQVKPEPKKPKYTLQEKIDKDINGCEPTQYISAEDATCIAKPVQTAVQQPQISSGNTYTPGQCTWYVKNLRFDIPNNWGNATDWLYNAQVQGWATGSTPKAGAIGWTYGHVVYVVSNNGDTVTITDMNYNWTPYATRTVDMPASMYTYIYE